MTTATNTELSGFAQTILDNKYAQEKLDGTKESWHDVAYRVASSILSPVFPEYVDEMTEAIAERKFMPGGRYLYSAGRPFQAVNNCYTLFADDSREGWAKLMHDAVHCLMSGGGIGVNYSAIRPYGARVGGLGGICTGPIALMEAVNETARQIQAGGSRRAAVYASLHWWHPDVLDFIKLKDWDQYTIDAKAMDFNARAPMDMTNISVALDDDFFAIMDGKLESTTHKIGQQEYTVDRAWAEKVYAALTHNMLLTGEPGIQIDVGENAGEWGRNACTELTTRDHMDVCNLGSINMARIESLEEMERITELGTAFLLAGTIVGALPNDEVRAVRERTRRLGLGLMGLYDWLVARGHKYEANDELAAYLEVYRDVSRQTADELADSLGVSRPVKVRAIAPTGTIGILAETTSGIEPLFAAAYKRRYLRGTTWHYQYVVDAGAKRLVDEYGVDPDKLETAYDLAYDPERRIAFQAWVQQYVDHGISSTLNLPSPEEHAVDAQHFAAMLYKYLPQLRGLTAYPDGARGGQPLTVAAYGTAAQFEGVEYEEFGAEQGCKGGVCGI